MVLSILALTTLPMRRWRWGGPGVGAVVSAMFDSRLLFAPHRQQARNVFPQLADSLDALHLPRRQLEAQAKKLFAHLLLLGRQLDRAQLSQLFRLHCLLLSARPPASAARPARSAPAASAPPAPRPRSLPPAPGLPPRTASAPASPPPPSPPPAPCLCPCGSRPASWYRACRGRWGSTPCRRASWSG